MHHLRAQHLFRRLLRLAAAAGCALLLGTAPEAAALAIAARQALCDQRPVLGTILVHQLRQARVLLRCATANSWRPLRDTPPPPRAGCCTGPAAAPLASGLHEERLELDAATPAGAAAKLVWPSLSSPSRSMPGKPRCARLVPSSATLPAAAPCCASAWLHPSAPAAAALVAAVGAPRDCCRYSSIPSGQSEPPPCQVTARWLLLLHRPVSAPKPTCNACCCLRVGWWCGMYLSVRTSWWKDFATVAKLLPYSLLPTAAGPPVHACRAAAHS